MARTYTPPQYEGGFDPQARSIGFVETRAADNSDQILEQGRREVEQIQYLSKSYDRKATVDAAELRADAAQIRANYAEVEADFAQARVGVDAVKGLASMSQTLADTFHKMGEIQKAERLQQQEIGSAFGLGTQQEASTKEGNPDPNTNTPQGVTATQQTDDTNTIVVAETEGVDEVTKDDPLAGDDLRTPLQKHQRTIATARTNVYTAVQDLPGYVETRLQDPNFQYRLPDGRVITATTASTQAELNFIVNRVLSDFYNEAGIGGMPSEAVATVLVPAVNRLRSSITSVYGGQIARNNQQAVIDAADTEMSSGLSAGAPVGRVWTNLFTSYYASGKWRGNKAGATEAALDRMIDYAVKTKDTNLLAELERIQKRPGIKGTELGGQYADKFAKARDDIASGTVRSYQAQEGLDKIGVQSILDERLLGLSKATTDEQEREINQRTITQLEGLGTPEGLLKARELRGQSLSYNPFTFSTLRDEQNAGTVLTQAELQEKLDRGDITKQEAETLGWSSTGGQSAGQKAYEQLKAYKTDIDGVTKGLLLSAIESDSSGKTLDGVARQQYTTGQGKSIQADLNERISVELQNWLRLNPDAAKDPAMVRNKIKDLASKYKDEVKFDQENGGFQYTFGGGDGARVPIREVTPSISPRAGSQEVKDYRKYSGSQLTGVKGLNPTKDVFLDIPEIVSAHEAMIQGKTVPPRVEAVAKALGTNAETLVKAQARLMDIREVAEYKYVDRSAGDTYAYTDSGSVGSFGPGRGTMIGGINSFRLVTSIVGNESGGRSDAVNPHSGALGFAQLMPSNVRPWSREILGYEISPRQFLRSPDLQRRIVVGKVEKYLKQELGKGYTGDVLARRVASLWYSGNPNLWNNARPQYYNGHRYPSIGQYTSDILLRYRKSS